MAATIRGINPHQSASAAQIAVGGRKPE